MKFCPFTVGGMFSDRFSNFADLPGDIRLIVKPNKIWSAIAKWLLNLIQIQEKTKSYLGCWSCYFDFYIQNNSFTNTFSVKKSAYTGRQKGRFTQRKCVSKVNLRITQGCANSMQLLYNFNNYINFINNNFKIRNWHLAIIEIVSQLTVSCVNSPWELGSPHKKKRERGNWDHCFVMWPHESTVSPV